MKEAALVILKPDAMVKRLAGYVLTRLEESGLELVGAKLVKVIRPLAEEHYFSHRKKFFFKEIVSYLSGKIHHCAGVFVFVYWGRNANQKCRDIAGATNPEEADFKSIRGSCGRVTTKGIYENVIHVSATAKEAEREIKLWFKPDDILVKVYKTKIDFLKNRKEKVWA